MVQLNPLRDAKKLADRNRSDVSLLNRRHREAKEAAEAAESRLDAGYTHAFEDFFVPFAEAFAMLQNVTLDDLPTLEAVPELAKVDISLRQVSLSAVGALSAMTGGAAAGAAAGGVTFAAVGAFAAASTGTAISTLSGAAATSATLAWLGGGSLAAGGAGVAGGTVVLTSLVAAPVVIALGGFVYWKGKQAYQAQQKVAEDIRRVRARLDTDIAKSKPCIERMADTAGVVDRLTDAGLIRLPHMVALAERTADFATYTPAERALVAELAGIATAVGAVIACPIADEDGALNPLSGQTVDAAVAVADRLAA